MADVDTDESPLLVERDGAVVTLINNAPPRNPMGLAFIDALEPKLAELASDDSVRVVILRGAGDEHFSVGMHLKQLPEGIQKAGGIDALLDQRLRVAAAIENLNKPAVALIFGYCLGGGLALALACHFRLAALEGAQIGLPELELGTVPAWGGTARLTRCVGRAHALDVILRAKKLTGEQALEIGLVTEVWPNDVLLQRGMALAHELAAMPATAVAGVLRAVVGAGEAPLEEALAEERRAVLASMGTKDQHEGMMAFLQKRKPEFNQ